MNSFHLPMLKKVVIKNFDLYNKDVELTFKQLNIIYGTNGTGKSTLLHIILYSVIGPYVGDIKVTSKNFKKIEKRPLLNDYFFRSRMLTLNKEASVTVFFEIGTRKFEVTHSLYENKLSSLIVDGNQIEGNVVAYKTYESHFSDYRETEDVTKISKYLIFKYHQCINEVTGMPGDETSLITTLLDAMFFSEERKYTFWSNTLQELIIGKYILDYDSYEAYRDKKSDTKYLESQYKKKSETANFYKKFIEEEIRKREAEKNDEEAEISIDQIEDKLDKIAKEMKKNNSEIINCRNSLSHSDENVIRIRRKVELISEELANLNSEWYDNLLPDKYNNYYKKFINSMTEEICPVCGKEHSFHLEIENCIFCNESIEVKKEINLVDIDIKRKNLQTEINKFTKQLDIEQDEQNKTKKMLLSLEKKQGILNSESNKYKNMQDKSSEEAGELSNIDKERLETLYFEREEALRKWNDSKGVEKDMRLNLEENLESSFQFFSSMFEKYSNSFFGDNNNAKIELPFSVSGEFGSLDDLSNGKNLISFKLNGRTRDDAYMLSESQRIFTDLSFRFSILTTFHNSSFFICETPDSTLDSFHEINASKTFSQYINDGNLLILTANARSSKLINILYNKYKDTEQVNVIDLTEISNLALRDESEVNVASFERYIGGYFNEGK
ncbi:AAA family ATPase [Erwinia sp. CPCC 100877]|nr:AAA family ATPase [Erwinia sp. CPCC 100877]